MNKTDIAPSLAQVSYSEEAKKIVKQLGLEAHPEGGYYNRVYASNVSVELKDGRGERKALTHIYYLLSRGEHSVWHKITSDEIWNFYEGDPLELRLINPSDKEERVVLLGKLDETHVPSFLIPAGSWQTAKPLGEYVLVGCSMAPGFQWEDWSVLPEGCKTPLELPDIKE